MTDRQVCHKKHDLYNSMFMVVFVYFVVKSSRHTKEYNIHTQNSEIYIKKTFSVILKHTEKIYKSLYTMCWMIYNFISKTER